VVVLYFDGVGEWGGGSCDMIDDNVIYRDATWHGGVARKSNHWKTTALTLY